MTPNFNGIQVTENVVNASGSSCPAALLTNLARERPPSRWGREAWIFGVTAPQRTNYFYDERTYLAKPSILAGTGISSCTRACSQTYFCNGTPIGKFSIVRTFTAGTASGTPVTRVTVTKTAQ
jgi:hypothetical protein